MLLLSSPVKTTSPNSFSREQLLYLTQNCRSSKKLLAKKLSNGWLNADPSLIKKEFQTDEQDRKKIKALTKYAEQADLRQFGMVALIKESYKVGFLAKEERDFLNWTLQKQGIDYLDWCYETKGAKEKRRRLKGTQLSLFDLIEKPKVPEKKYRQLDFFTDIPHYVNKLPSTVVGQLSRRCA